MIWKIQSLHLSYLPVWFNRNGSRLVACQCDEWSGWVFVTWNWCSATNKMEVEAGQKIAFENLQFQWWCLEKQLNWLFIFDLIRRIPLSVRATTMKTNTFIVLDFNSCVQIFAANEFFSLMCHFRSFFFCPVGLSTWANILSEHFSEKISFKVFVQCAKGAHIFQILPSILYICALSKFAQFCMCVCWHIYVSNKILR